MPQITDRLTGEIIELTDEELAERRERTLLDWYHQLDLAIEAKKVVEREQELRKEVASLFFLEPEEGTNTYELTAGYKLKLTHKIDRKIDEASLDAVREQLKGIGISIDTLVSYKPSLELKAYKGLKQVNPEAGQIFDQALTIKPASPTLELVAPKTK